MDAAINQYMLHFILEPVLLAAYVICLSNRFGISPISSQRCKRLLDVEPVLARVVLLSGNVTIKIKVSQINEND